MFVYWYSVLHSFVFSVQLGNGEHGTDVLVYSIVGMFVYWYSVLYSFVFSVQLGNGEHGTDVRVRNNRLHCQNCYSNDEGKPILLIL
jgi:hypothetical protein